MVQPHKAKETNYLLPIKTLVRNMVKGTCSHHYSVHAKNEERHMSSTHLEQSVPYHTLRCGLAVRSVQVEWK